MAVRDQLSLDSDEFVDENFSKIGSKRMTCVILN